MNKDERIKALVERQRIWALREFQKLLEEVQREPLQVELEPGVFVWVNPDGSYAKPPKEGE